MSIFFKHLEKQRELTTDERKKARKKILHYYIIIVTYRQKLIDARASQIFLIPTLI